MWTTSNRRFHHGLALLVVAVAAAPAAGRVLWTDETGEQHLALDTTLKSSGLATYGHDDAVLFPDRFTGAGLWRLRLGLDYRFSDQANARFDYENRARWVERATPGGMGAALPRDAEAPYRVCPLEDELAERKGRLFCRHELDRAYLALHPDWGEVTVGRQAIGLGRGAVFTAVDVFAPFSPLEFDREWRRGVDAVRAEYRLSDTSSAEVLGVFGQDRDGSALLARLRGYVGEVDGELIIGKRAEDTMYAGVVSAAVGDAEVHMEAALFDTPEPQPDGGLFGSDHLVGKTVLGSSYTFDVGNGLTLLGEYHYCGFGVRDLRTALARLANPTFQERFLRGDMQILGRHAVAASLTYPFNDDWTGSLMVLQSPRDGSGLVAPSVDWRMSDHASLRMTTYVPWGAKPSGGILKSEYGGTPYSVFMQLTLYF